MPGPPHGTLNSLPQRILCFWNSRPALVGGGIGADQVQLGDYLEGGGSFGFILASNRSMQLGHVSVAAVLCLFCLTEAK